MADALTPDAIVEQILKVRGYKTKEARANFLQPDYEKNLHDPYLLHGMDVAVKRLKKAHKNKEIIAVYGDYDIDGLSATALLYDAMTTMGFKLIHHIPDRFSEGYGMSKTGVDAVAEKFATLIVTVDCGSTSVTEVDYANEKGIDVIVSDHHEPPKQLPDAIAILNPKVSGNKYPFKSLAGVGVAFKLVQALQKEFSALEKGQEKWLLDLVAFGTVCDVVDLVDENRELVHWGLKVLANTRRRGFMALADTSEVELEKVSPVTLGYVFGPRLNAAGRLESANQSLKLLRAEDNDQAMELAAALEKLNNKRREKQTEIFDQAAEKAAKMNDDQVLVISGENWAEGIVGIVASKIMERFKKPTFIIAELKGNVSKGSGRSFGDFSVVSAIRASNQHLLKGGGHDAAGGVSLNTDKIGDWRQAINQYHKGLGLSNQASFLYSDPDMTFLDLGPLSLELFDALEVMQPFGAGNREPLFELKDVKLSDVRRVGKENQHLKAVFKDSDGNTLEAIGFGKGGQPIEVGDVKSPLIRLRDNEFRGHRSVQAQIVTI